METFPGRETVGAKKQVEVICTADGRLLCMRVKAGFDDLDSFAPDATTAGAAKPTSGRAYLTADDLPLQIVYLQPDQGWRVDPHVHPPIAAPEVLPRHQVLVCTAGSARIGVYTASGDHLADVDLVPGDLILLCEGHSVEALLPGTRLIEIRQGPANRADPNDFVLLETG